MSGERVDLERALAWAAPVLGEPIAGSRELSGGLTSTMLVLTGESGREAVLRLMTEEPWRTHGAGLTSRERLAQQVLESTAIPAPVSLGLDADGAEAGVAAHLMSRVPGVAVDALTPDHLGEMARLLTDIHDVVPDEPFREFQSWAWEAKWVVPEWTQRPDDWRRAFDILAGPAPAYEPVMMHRDFSHRNLLWDGATITGVVDWVETSTGPAGLDAAHAATNLAVAFGVEPTEAFLRAYAERSGAWPERHWLVMDAVGFLPPPGREPMFGEAGQLERLDAWLAWAVESE